MATKEYMRALRLAHPGYMTSYSRDYREENREKINARAREQYRKHPLEVKARSVASNAVRLGKLEHKPCEVCGNPAEFHHDDYNKPLEVRHLCKDHHVAVHL